ncbi:MAG: hypothetical protein QOJ23_3187 [Actinomycetota bacterium]|jgi:hypothetical protein|nr:hypothetical protein [Actinomycetota bacterium]
MSGFRIRHEDIPDDALVVIRGGVMDADFLRHDARMTFLRFGEYGVSVLAAPDEDGLREVEAGPLRRYRQLTIATVGAIRRVGLELRPTFRRPHYTVIFPTLDDGVRRLLSCDNDVIDNPHHDIHGGEEGR